MLNLVKVINKDSRWGECALYDTDYEFVIFTGNYRYGISTMIDEFLVGLDYTDVDYTFKEIEINNTHELFDECEFEKEEV